MPSWKLVLGTFSGFLGLIVVGSALALWIVQVPDPVAASQSQKNVYYWDDGTQMVVAGGGQENRQQLAYNKMPQSMRNAVISAENASFYQDSGVDPMGIVRAVGRMAMGGETQSGSTITQQYVKNTFLDQSQTVTRKLKELFISIKVGAVEKKSKIITGYLNTGYYGRGAYGLQAAAQAYFYKDAEDLTPSECAFLSSTLNGPNLYDPYGGVGASATEAKNSARAKARWAWTLKREVATHRMTQAQADHWKSKGFPKIKPPRKSTELKGQKGYMVDLANNYVKSQAHISDQQLKRGGLRIYTTFNKRKMDEMENAVKRVRKANINPKKRKVDKYVQFGGASVKPGDGAIKAMYGGEDATVHFRNNADYTGVQVGSTFKPFVLASAMRDGKRDPKGPEQQTEAQRTKVSPSSVYNGNNKIKLRDYDGRIWHDKEGGQWRQKNDGGQDMGKISLRTAMEQSVNTPYIQLGMDVGRDKVKQAALDAGVNKESLAKTTPTFSLGTSAPSAIRMANAYGTFANRGVASDPYSVKKVVRKGEVQYRHADKKRNAFDQNVADNVTDVLHDVVQHGTGKTAQGLHRPAAGKTGTTDDNKSAWFTGYTPQLSTSVGMWRVNDRAKVQHFRKMYGVGNQKQIHGMSFPADIWTDYMKQALDGQRTESFHPPGPLGDKVYGDGASPPPTPTHSDTPSHTPSNSPSDTPTHSPSDTPSDSPSETCDMPLGCSDKGQTGDGGDTAGNGDDKGQDKGQTGGDDGGTGDTGNDDDGGGGWFGGPTGSARRDE